MSGKQYMKFDTNPTSGPRFATDFLTAMDNDQILVVFYEDFNWNVWLLPYSLQDWKPLKDQMGLWIEWNKRNLGFDGSWKSFYNLSKSEYQNTELKRKVASKLFKGHTLDIRVKPRKPIPFGIITPSFTEHLDRLRAFLTQNVSREHNGVDLWSNITNDEMKTKLCSRITENRNECVSKLNNYEYPLLLLTKDNSYDLVGGHCKLYELIMAIDNFGRTPTNDEEWITVMRQAELNGFFREMAEELGLLRQPQYDYDNVWKAYIGKVTGPSDVVWVYVDFADPDIPAIIYINMTHTD